ncbi:MAG: YfcE family phosphodiesterase [Thermoprotei archaeon]|nr:YfcE family phosphodiesterase [Thermoprotei archaeon]
MAEARILVVSDSHIPDRADEIPREISGFMEEGEPYDIVVHAGDLTSRSTLEYFTSLGPKAYIVQGNMDWLDLPDYEVFEVHGVKIGVVHGDQVYPRGDLRRLTRIAGDLGVRVLVWGHTHKPLLAKVGNVIHINPGSITGAYSGAGASYGPSLVIARVKASGRVLLEARLYVLDGDRVVERYRLIEEF